MDLKQIYTNELEITMIDQTLFIPRHSPAVLYKALDEGGLKYMEGPRLLTDFYVGGAPRVGSLNTRTFGADWWGTSNVMSIEEIKTTTQGQIVHIHFKTLNSVYVLETNNNNMTYRDDLELLITQTQEDIQCPRWLILAEEMALLFQSEYEERKGNE